MATSTERFGFTKPAGSDPASVVPLNSNTDLIELYLGRTQDSIAPLYDDTETYSVGDLRTYESRLYKCNTDISTPETFDPEKWDLTTAVQEGGGGGSGASAIEKTQAEYNELTPAQKTNGAIYMVQDDGTGDYEYHTNQAETIVVRVNKTTNEIEWFFVDYTFAGGSVEQIPSELVDYLPASTISGNAYDTSLQTMMGYVAINAQGGFGLYPTDYSREIAGTVKCLLKNTDGTEQANTYTDPYEGTGDAVNRIYYMGTEYANTNGGSGGSSEAGDINYDNTTSQLTADNVQDAIDEVVANADTASDDILTLQNVQGYDAYDETQTYAVGDYAIYNNHVYECTTAVSTAEPFDSTKWSQTSIEQIIDGVKGDISQLNSSFTNIATTIQNATIPSGYTGTCQYIKLGRIVILAGTVNSTNAIPANSAFVTGLPSPLVSNPTIRVLNNNAVNNIYDCIIQGAGTIAPAVQTGSNVSMRITGAYISAN